MPVFRIQHITKYEYDRPVQESVNQVRIFPFQNEQQEVLQHHLMITGEPDIHQYSDYWGNRTGMFNLMLPHRELVIDSRLTVRTLPASIPGEDHGLDEMPAEVNREFKLLELSKADLITSQKAIEDIVNEIYQPGMGVTAILKQCCAYIFEQFSYIKGITSVETTVDEILNHRAGVCQDFAHIMLQVIRSLGIPSRYVSGYICPNKNGLRGEGATHAWVEAWLPKEGWKGIDPTNNMWVTNDHVKLAVGRNFNDCSPVKGSFKGSANQNLSVYVSVGYEDGKTFEETNKVKGKETAVVAAVEAAQQ